MEDVLSSDLFLIIHVHDDVIFVEELQLELKRLLDERQKAEKDYRMMTSE